MTVQRDRPQAPEPTRKFWGLWGASLSGRKHHVQQEVLVEVAKLSLANNTPGVTNPIVVPMDNRLKVGFLRGTRKVANKVLTTLETLARGGQTGTMGLVMVVRIMAATATATAMVETAGATTEATMATDMVMPTVAMEGTRVVTMEVAMEDTMAVAAMVMAMDMLTVVIAVPQGINTLLFPHFRTKVKDRELVLSKCRPPGICLFPTLGMSFQMRMTAWM